MTDVEADERFIGLVDADGNPIRFPSLFLTAVMRSRDWDEIDVLYATLSADLVAQASRPALDKTAMGNKADNLISERRVQSALAAQVVVEFVLGATETGVPMSMKEAISRTARWRHEYVAKGSSKSLERQIEKSVTDYRSVLHVLAAAAVASPVLLEVDDEPDAFRAFLQVARGFEMTLDQHAAASPWSWSPLRIDPALPALLPAYLRSRTGKPPRR